MTSAHWAALLVSPPQADSPRTDLPGVPGVPGVAGMTGMPGLTGLMGIALWALQFTPRVACLEESVVMEVAASMHLFGGETALRERVARGACALGVPVVSWAPNSLAALALARCAVADGFSQPLSRLLDRLPLSSLSAVAMHQPTLARLGCRALGDVRRLPRGGVSRRFDKEVLMALDQAYGLRPMAHQWISVPESFCLRLELPGRVDTAAALMFGAHRLLLQLCGWLAARSSGVTAYALRWLHDAMRHKTAGEGGEIIIRTAWATRDVNHLERLLSEHLARLTLLAPVGELELAALEVMPLPEESKSLLHDSVRAGGALGMVLERIAARLGPERVLRPQLAEDHRLEWMQSWSPASEVASAPKSSRLRMADIAQPTWLFEPPLRLAVSRLGPLYQGPLQLVIGPHRVEGGWWHRQQGAGEQPTHNVQRDYWVARSQHAGILWVYQERLVQGDARWFLHGVFA